MNTDKHRWGNYVELGSVTRSTGADVLTLELLQVTNPRSGIRVHLCPSVVEMFFYDQRATIEIAGVPRRRTAGSRGARNPCLDAARPRGRVVAGGAEKHEAGDGEIRAAFARTGITRVFLVEDRARNSAFGTANDLRAKNVF